MGDFSLLRHAGSEDGDALMSCSEPLAGPGPSAPADTGTPVSATVGITGDSFTSGRDTSDETVSMAGDTEGIGAGAWFKTAGSNTGDPTEPGAGTRLLPLSEGMETVELLMGENMAAEGMGRGAETETGAGTGETGIPVSCDGIRHGLAPGGVTGMFA